MPNLIGYGAAQVFQPSRDPGEAIREYFSGTKQQQKTKEDLRKDQAKYGTSPFNVEDFKRWEDDKGYQELVQTEASLRDVWNKAYQSGYNIKNPRTASDARLSKAYYDKFQKFREASQLYTGQGERFGKVVDDLNKLKPEEYDQEATRANMESYLNASSVFERSGMTEGLIVRKDKPFDSLKYVAEMILKMAPTQKFITSEDIDPETGKIRKATWEGIPESARKDAIRMMYNSGDARFRKHIEELRKQHPTQDDPNWDGAEFAANWYGKVREGAKQDVIYYGVSGAGKRSLGLAPGAGKPEKDADGNYMTNEDTLHLYNANDRRKVAHTSTHQVSLSTDELFGKKAAHMQITVSDQVINSETGEKEVVGSQALFRPSKIVWFPVTEGVKEDQGIWSKAMSGISSLFNAQKYPPGTILSDQDLAGIQESIIEDPSKVISNWIWRPYVIGQLGYERKEGTIGDDERILNLNRSVYVPYEDVSDDLVGKFGKSWAPAVGEDIIGITLQLNSGIETSPGSGITYKDLNL